MVLPLSKRSRCVTQSEIRTMSIECDRVGGINLSQGVCDTEAPAEVRRAAQVAIENGQNTYSRFDGIPELRSAIARHLARYGMNPDPETEIIVSAGSTGAFYCACLALLDPGDEVILFEPSYGYHIQTLEAVGAIPRYVTLRSPDWKFTPQDLDESASPRTRGIMVNTPANPSGKVFSREELEVIGRFAGEHDLVVFTDEIYEHFVYDGRRHVPPATVPILRDRTITISGFSKTFSITGWRIGYSVSPAPVARTIGHFNDLVYVCAPSPLQHGAQKGLDALTDDYYEALRLTYHGKREKICGALARAKLDPFVPQGAYYVLADISTLPGDDSKGRAMHLLERTGVACVPGEAFFANPRDGDSLARFCFAKQERDLDEACRRLERIAGC